MATPTNSGDRQGVGKTLLRAGLIGAGTAAGTAAGYYGGGALTNQIMRSPRMQRWAASRTPAEITKALRRAKLVTGTLAMPAAAVGSVYTVKAIEDEVEKLRRKGRTSRHEKVATVYDTYYEALKRSNP